MQIQAEQDQVTFDIIHNARSSKATRSRKSSIQMSDKDKPKMRFKKDRKMTMNPESFVVPTMRNIQHLQHQHQEVQSEKDMKEEEEINIDDFLELGEPRKVQSQKQIDLENGIYFGIASERELDSDFNWSRSLHSTNIDLDMKD